MQLIERRYALENELLNAVSHINEERATGVLSELIAAFSLSLRLTDELRARKDLAVTLNALLRKTAEAAGIHPIHIDSYFNHNIQTIEGCTSLEQTVMVCQKLVHGYCRLIRERTISQYSLLVQKVITYANSDLRADLSLNALARNLSVSANYLSTLFKKEVGIPLTDYVNRCRVENAKRLLLASSDPVKSIASQCGVEDVNYFTRIFKNQTGVTPKAFRETHKHYPMLASRQYFFDKAERLDEENK